MSRARIILPGEKVDLPRRGRFRGGSDPSSAPRILFTPRPMMDTRPHRNVGNRMAWQEIQAAPDDLLVAVLVEHGMPVWLANELRRSPMHRAMAFDFYMMVLDAQEGDADAKERVDLFREQQQQMREIELISETPEHTIGLWER